MKPGKTGLIRIFDATAYSCKGIQHCWKNEAAFRQEAWLAAILLPASFFVGSTTAEIALLILCVFMVLITELLNTGIEAIVDKASPEIHPLAAAAKDCGSAAVLFSLVATGTVWLIVLVSNFA